MKPKVLLFDLDGTLIPSWQFIMISFDYVLSHFGLAKDGLSHPMMRHCTLNDAYVHLGLGSQLEEAKRIHIEFQNNNFHLLGRFPDSVTTMQKLRPHFGLGIVSNRKKNGPDILKQCDLFDYFDLIVGAEDVNRSKPHPECIYHALDFFGVEAHEVVIIGDTTADIEAGKRIGALTVGIDGSDCLQELRQANPDHLLSSRSELVSLWRI